MSKGIWLVNGTCCALLLWGGLKMSRDWKVFAAAHQVSLLKNSSDRVNLKGAAAKAAPVTEAWTEIFSRNPFSFDRSDIDIAPVVPEAPRVVLPKPVLYGVIDLGKGLVAMLGDRGSKRSQQNVKVGEQFKGWTVLKIEERAVVMESNGVEESIVMGAVPIDRDAGKTSMSASAPSVTSTAAPSPPPAPAASAPASPPAAAPAGTKTIDTPFGPQPVQTP